MEHFRAEGGSAAKPRSGFKDKSQEGKEIQRSTVPENSKKREEVVRNTSSGINVAERQKRVRCAGEHCVILKLSVTSQQARCWGRGGAGRAEV